MKKPILGIGLLMFGLFIYQVSRDKNWGIFHNPKFTSTTCQAVERPLKKKIPGNWKIFCEGNNLAVEINEVTVPRDASNLKPLLYRQLVNHMSFIAHNTHSDLMEKILFVRFKLIHSKLTINAVTEGKFLIKLSTLESPEHIMSHLKSTVQVKVEGE